ncbi:hypothetical protein RAS1_01670 [Phycisphaerae bacterium RAS1]|nr:hypothetical protein RAS1_01670 [Phycisphaerae bacterium RAS1]
MRAFRIAGRSAIAFSSTLAIATTAAADFPITLQAFDHPNALSSADPHAPDARDYGLRLDTAAGLQSFHFVDVSMTFLNPPEPGSDTVMATLTGTIAHLQSTHGGITGYTPTSGFDVQDQLYQIDAQFRIFGLAGSWFGANSGPYENMFADLIAGGINAGNKIQFALHDTTLTPLFQGPAVFDGPLVYDERPGGDGNPNLDSFYIRYRDRLDPAFFASPQWDVVSAAGWLEPAVDGGTPYENDFLFYLTPEPASALLLLAGGMLTIKRR